jgi:hypothetical protein
MFNNSIDPREMLQVRLSLEIDFHGAFTRMCGEVLGEQEQELMPLCLAHAFIR